jgi:hypothetical protein
LLDTRLQSHKESQQQNLQNSQGGASGGRHQGQHDGRKHGEHQLETASLTVRASRRKGSDINLKTLNSCYLVNSLPITSGCANPTNLSTTALIDTGANISLLQHGAPSSRAPTQLPSKSVNQPKGNLLTTETLLLLLTKLPSQARIAHRAPGITNNLLAASNLVDAGCELFFHSTGCEVTHNGDHPPRVERPRHRAVANVPHPHRRKQHHSGFHPRRPLRNSRGCTASSQRFSTNLRMQ